jgi:hypothetical protein
MGDTQLPLRTGEGIINLTPSRVVGDFMMDVHAHSASASRSRSTTGSNPHYQLLCVYGFGENIEGKSIAQPKVNYSD